MAFLLTGLIAGDKVSDGTYRQIFFLYFEAGKIPCLLNMLGKGNE
jgi:hypothetical protein